MNMKSGTVDILTEYLQTIEISSNLFLFLISPRKVIILPEKEAKA